MTFLLCVALVASAAAQAPQGQDWQSRLRSAIERATTQNPDVASMEARIEASRRRVAQSAALPDPEIEIGIKDIPPSNLSLSRDDFTMETIAARQRFPAFGMLAADKRSSQAELEGALAGHTRHVAEIAADVTDSFFRVAELDRRVAILEQTRQRLSDAIAAARERYRVGKGAQADVLRAGLEKTALQDRLAAVKASRRAEAARWVSLQNLPASTNVPAISLETEMDVEPLILMRPISNAEDLLGQVEQGSPILAAARADLRRAEEQLERARLERRPEWMVSGYYGRREKFEDLAGLSVSLSLPWVHPRRLDERRAERQAELESARADLAAARNGLQRDLDQAFAMLEQNREQTKLYRDSILPQAEINYRAAAEAYAQGAIDFLSYIRAATDLDVYQEELAQRETGTARALAQLQKASGLPLIVGTPTSEEDHGKQ